MQSMRQLMNNMVRDPRYQETYKQTIQAILDHEAVQQFIDEHETELSQQIIENSLSKLNEFVRELKAIEKGEQGQNPGFVPRLFINTSYIDITYVPTNEFIEQEARRKKQALLDNRMMSADVRQAKLQDFTMESYERQQLMEAIVEFVQKYRTNPLATQGLYISGPFGVGKTFLLGALANELVNYGVAVTMLHYPTFTGEIKNTISTNMTQPALNRVKRVPILILDDCGAETNSAWLRDEVLGVILEHRMKESLPTFFTSNLTMDQFESHLANTRDEVDGVKARRLMERVRYLAIEKHLGGDNRRHLSR